MTLRKNEKIPKDSIMRRGSRNKKLQRLIKVLDNTGSLAPRDDFAKACRAGSWLKRLVLQDWINLK